MARKYVKVKRAKYGWKRAGGEGLVRTLSVDEGEHFTATGQLPKPGNVSSITEGVGHMYSNPDPLRVAARKRGRAKIERKARQPIRAHRWALTTNIIKRFEALDRGAKIMVAHIRRILTTDEAAKLAADVNDKFNTVMKARDLGARIEFKTADSLCLRELWPGAGMQAMDALTTMQDDADARWALELIEDLAMVWRNPELPDQFRQFTLPEAKKEWDKRLRQTKEGKAFRAAEAIQQGKDQQADHERKAARTERSAALLVDETADEDQQIAQRIAEDKGDVEVEPRSESDSAIWDRQGGFHVFDPFRKR
jgi:hypothetical protein